MLVAKQNFRGFICFKKMKVHVYINLWPHCLSLWKSQHYLKNQCELFMQESNPQIYGHLIRGYGTALMARIPSNRCPSSGTQVRLHLVTCCTFPLLCGWAVLWKHVLESWYNEKNILQNVDIKYLWPQNLWTWCKYEYYVLIWMIFLCVPFLLDCAV